MQENIFDFNFGGAPSRIVVGPVLPSFSDAADGGGAVLAVCDANTEDLARRILGGAKVPLCVLPPGESAKGWPSVEAILKDAALAGLGRDGLILGIGGGVVTDLAAFAAAVYMRGVRVRLVSTTLLGMVDAAMGGKTGFDFLGIKNLVGAFHVAERVYMPAEALGSLPLREWKSGMAEVVKTAIITDGELFALLEAGRDSLSAGPDRGYALTAELLSRCVAAKGRIVETDPFETGTSRALLNLGHTFGHGLEAVAGLGRLSHGEAVAWGMARACELGAALGITPPARVRRIRALLDAYGYETAAPHPAARDADAVLAAMRTDKKKKAGVLRFVVPSATGAELTALDDGSMDIIKDILKGAVQR